MPQVQMAQSNNSSHAPIAVPQFQLGVYRFQQAAARVQAPAAASAPTGVIIIRGNGNSVNGLQLPEGNYRMGPDGSPIPM
jgi:hypothetical protein